MLEPQKWNTLQALLGTMSRDEQLWTSGYLCGILGRNTATAEPTGSSAASVPASASAATASVPAIKRISLVYGTETGNAKKLAIRLAPEAKKAGFQVKVTAVDQYRFSDLPQAECFLFIVSTQGDGEPPAAALKFYEHLKSAAGNCGQLRFAVLGLGDSAYPLFCQAGIDADELLEKTGARRLVALQKADTDYEDTASEWFTSVLGELRNAVSHTTNAPSTAVAEPAAATTAAKKSRALYKGTIASNINLNDTPSKKETHHIELQIDDSVTYQPGDAAGFVPHNCTEDVAQILSSLALSGSEVLEFRGERSPVEDLLTRRISIRHLSERVQARYADLLGVQPPAARHDLLQLLNLHPPAGKVSTQDLLAVLEPIAPRLYSIASSPSAHTGELHLTVARNAFQNADGAVQYGLCSNYLSQLPANFEVDFYIHANNNFRLPAEERDVIMIGPGTGIAPFRSFLFERDAQGASGRNWLFFGEQHFVTDFLYQTELQDFLKMGILTRLDVAFSRDQEHKIYVQHRIEENAAELYAWLQGGASLYVCGSKTPMSVDVENALLAVLRKEGNLSEAAARDYLEQLTSENRYLKDVY